LSSYSHFNNQGRENTIIDHFYANAKLEIGSLLILHDREEIKDAGASLFKISQSDHLALYTWVKMSPAISLRQPKIDKQRMMQLYQNMNGEDLARSRRNFFDEFRKIHLRCMVNRAANYSKA